MMNTERFEQLAKGLAQCAGLAFDDPFHTTRVLKVNGVETFLFYDEAFDPDRLQIRMDFGDLPNDPRQLNDLMLSVLAMNFTYGLGGLAVFSVNPEDAHLVLTTQHTLEPSMAPQDLLVALKESNAQAVFAWEEINGKAARQPKPFYFDSPA
jgi:hypothetical protein